MTTGTLIELQANLKALNLSSMARNMDATCGRPERVESAMTSFSSS